MALQWADNFSQYGIGTTTVRQLMSDGLYASALLASTTADPDPFATGNVLFFFDSNPSFNDMRKVLSSNQTTVGAAARIWLPTLPVSVPMNVFRFQDPSNVNQVAIQVTSTGAIRVMRGEGWAGTLGNENVILGTSTGPAIVASAWNHIEAWVHMGVSDGTVVVKINGTTTVINLSGIRTINTNYASPYVAQIGIDNRLSASGTGKQYYMKDLVMCDSTGSYNNTFVGTVTVETLFPDGDIDLNWTPSTGSTGFNLIDNAPPVDTEYISAGDPPPDASVFSMTDLPEDVTSVKGIVTVVRARKTDGGDAQLQVGLVSNGDVDLGLDRPITTAFTYWYDISEEDPDTAAPWSPAAVDAAYIQVDRTL